MPLGNDPIVDDIILTAGADFTHRVNAGAGETIPIGTTAVIGIYSDQETATAASAIWPATAVTGGYIAWRVESDDADEIEAGMFYRLYVSYDDDPTLEHCWYRGKVKRKQ